MKRLFAVLLTVLCFFSCGIRCSAFESSFELTPETLEQLGSDALEYLPEQKIYHFTRADTVTIDLPVSGGMYIRAVLGGYRSSSNGITDNGINHVCDINVSCRDENGELQFFRAGSAVVLMPGDGKFYLCSLGSDDMYAGLPEGAANVSVTIHADNDTAYIKSLYISSSDTIARDMTPMKTWDVTAVGNINAQTSLSDYLIMIGFICAVAGIMMIIARVRKKYTKGRIK